MFEGTIFEGCTRVEARGVVAGDMLHVDLHGWFVVDDVELDGEQVTLHMRGGRWFVVPAGSHLMAASAAVLAGFRAGRDYARNAAGWALEDAVEAEADFVALLPELAADQYRSGFRSGFELERLVKAQGDLVAGW